MVDEMNSNTRSLRLAGLGVLLWLALIVGASLYAGNTGFTGWVNSVIPN